MADDEPVVIQEIGFGGFAPAWRRRELRAEQKEAGMAVRSWRIVEMLFRPPRAGPFGWPLGPQYIGWHWYVDADGATPVEYPSREAAEAALASEMSSLRGTFDAKYPSPTIDEWQNHGPPLLMVVPYDAAAYRIGRALGSEATSGGSTGLGNG